MAETSVITSNWPAFLSDPTPVLDSLLTESCSDESISSAGIQDAHTRIAKEISLIDRAHINEIPLANSLESWEDINDRSLVRFNCMVQDMFDPEFFLSRCETQFGDGARGVSFGLYRNHISRKKNSEPPGDTKSEDIDIDHESDLNVMSDRMTYMCITIPGENKWVKVKQRDIHASDLTTSVHSLAVSSEGTNRPNECLLDKCFPLKRLPLEKVCFVKVYDSGNIHLKLNDIVEVIGIIDFSEKSSTNFEARSVQGEGEQTLSSFHLPARIAPEIHALVIRKLNHINPLLLSSPLTSVLESRSSVDFCQGMRRQLHSLLSQCLFGDDLAANYLLCCLLSRVYSRKDVMALGSFPVGISGLSPTIKDEERTLFVKSLYQLLSGIATHSSYLPLSLDNLNAKSFVPKKDYGLDKLESGCLQLPVGSLLLIDETAMKVGQLNPQGVKNITSIGHLIRWQQIKYDFEFHTLDIDTDISVVVLSEGKSLLPVSYRVQLKVSQSIMM